MMCSPVVFFIHIIVLCEALRCSVSLGVEYSSNATVLPISPSTVSKRSSADNDDSVVATTSELQFHHSNIEIYAPIVSTVMQGIGIVVVIICVFVWYYNRRQLVLAGPAPIDPKLTTNSSDSEASVEVAESSNSSNSVHVGDCSSENSNRLDSSESLANNHTEAADSSDSVLASKVSGERTETAKTGNSMPVGEVVVEVEGGSST